MRYLSIILPVPLRQTFTYHLEDDEAEICIGSRVVVTFGGQKYVTGIIQDISATPFNEISTRPVENILDQQPLVSEVQLKYWQWIADYYMCSIGEVMKAALPSGLLMENKTQAILNPDFESTAPLKGNEAMVYNQLSNGKAEDIAKLAKLIGVKNIAPILKRLVDKNALVLEDNVHQKYKPKLKTYFHLSAYLTRDETALEKTFEELSRANKQQQMLSYIISESEENKEDIDKSFFLKKYGFSASIYNSLQEKGFITERQKEISRLDPGKVALKAISPLSEAQQKALDITRESFKKQKPVLLHGVTASGKTEVYIHLIKEQLDKGKQVLFLLPEIAITVDMLRRLMQIFGDRISVYHSRYSDAQRVEIWQKCNKAEESHIVIGARSAVFLPFRNLGLIVVDEEHEDSYKQQEPAPHYHARDAAVMLAHLCGANIILGSATPSIESAYNGQRNKYTVTHLMERFTKVPLPQIIPVDMSEAYKKGKTKHHFSFELIAQIKEALKSKEQIILFQNRRGYSGFVECKACGHVPQCPNCDISLTYHQYRRKLSCHYCGHEEEVPDKCPQCNSPEFNDKGLGTEKVAEHAAELFPTAKIQRFDQDSTRGKGDFERIITQFNEGKTDILVGTQMIAKGLDFDNVGLVAIMNADNMMNFPDFRAHEKAYQLMSQVSGRSGRRSKQGKVILQSYTPDYHLIKTVISYDYNAFYTQQITERQEFNYPPFVRLISITVKHKDWQTSQYAARVLADKLRERFGLFALGPEAPSVGRVKLFYLQKIMLKVSPKFPLSAVKEWIINLSDAITQHENFKGTKIVFDVDI